MKTSFKKIAAAVLIAVLAFASLPAAAFAAAGGPAVTGYTVTDTAGKTLSGFQKGASVNMTVTVKDTSVATNTVAVSAIDAAKLLDSFTGGTISAAVLSSGTDPLTYRLTISGLIYSGSGRSLKLLVGYKGNSSGYDTLEIPVAEAEESSSDSTSAVTVPEPGVLIGFDSINTFYAGQERTVTVVFKNIGSAAVTSARVTFTPSDSLMLTGNSSTMQLDDIAPGATKKLDVRIRALSTISSAAQSLSADLKFVYYNGSAGVQGSASEKLTVPAAVTSEPEKTTVPEPMLIITRSAITAPITSGQTFSVDITLKNAGAAAVINPVVSISAPDALYLLNDVSTFQPGTVSAGQSVSMTLKFKAAKDIAAAAQSVGVDVRYSYNNGTSLTQATYSDKVSIPTVVAASSQSTDGPVPNIIISGFSCGGDSVAAGSSFSLSISIKNTGVTDVGNLVAVIDGGDSFTMNGSTNTFFFNSIKAGGTQTLKVPMQALSGAKTGAQNVEVTLRYEYVDGGKRNSANAVIKLAVPVYQTDRFSLDQPVIPDYIYVGSESMITIAFVNKGKGDVSNVQASIDGDITIPSKVQYLGNFEAGKSGTIAFAVTPNNVGSTPVKIQISYEDANQQVKTKEYDLTLNVQGNADPGTDSQPEPEPTAKTGFPVWAWIVIGAAVTAAVIIAVAVSKHKKDGSGKADAAWEDWEEVPYSAPDGNKPQETKKGV